MHIFASFRWQLDAPSDNDAFVQSWQGFESSLIARFPDATRLLTPTWEPTFDRREWRAFLRAHGYSPTASSTLAFAKSLH